MIHKIVNILTLEKNPNCSLISERFDEHEKNTHFFYRIQKRKPVLFDNLVSHVITQILYKQ